MPLSPTPQLSALAVAVSMVVGGLVVVGCDQPADVAVRQDLSAAYAYRSGGDEQRRYVEAAEKAAQDSSGGDYPAATASQAQELLGDVKAESAGRFLDGRAADGDDGRGLIALESLALSLAGQATQLADAVALGATYIKGQQASNPQATLDLIAQKSAAVRTGESWQPAPGVEASLPSLTQVDARIEEINAQIQQLENRDAEMEKQRSDKLGRASALDEQSLSQSGKAGVDLYRQVSDLRNESSALSAEQTKLDGRLMAAKQDLAEQQALKAALETAVDDFGKQQETLSTGWQGVQAQIAKLRSINDASFGGGGAGAALAGDGTASAAPADSVEALSRQLADAVGRMEKQGEEAVRLLDASSSAYTKASDRATRAGQDAGRVADKKFSAALTATFDTKRITLKQSIAKRQLGHVHAASATVYAAMMRLQASLEAGGRSLPSGLAADPKAKYAEAVAAAADAYTEADDQISNVTDSASGALQAAAISQKAVLVAGMLGLNELVQSTGVQVASGLPSASELQAMVTQVVAAARDANVTLPPVAAFAAAAASLPSAPASGGTGMDSGMDSGMGGQPATTPPAEGEVAPGDSMNPDDVPAPAATGMDPQ